MLQPCKYDMYAVLHFVCTSMMSSRTYHKHSTVQSALRKTAKQAHVNQSSTTQAGRQELARASMSSSIHAARYVLRTDEEIELCLAYKKVYNSSQSSFAGVMREEFPFASILNNTRGTALLSVLFSTRVCVSHRIYTHAVCGLFSWSMELLPFLQVVKVHLKSRTSLLALFAFCSILPGERV